MLGSRLRSEEVPTSGHSERLMHTNELVAWEKAYRRVEQWGGSTESAPRKDPKSALKPLLEAFL